MTYPPGPGPYDAANAPAGSHAPYGSGAPGGHPQDPSYAAGGPQQAVPPYPGAAQHAAAPQYPGGSYPAAGYGPPAYYPKNSLAVWSLVLGIAAFVLGFGLLTGIPAVIVGSSAKRAVAEGQADNESMATIGIVLGWVSIGLSVLAVVALFAFLPAFLAFVDAIPDQS